LNYFGGRILQMWLENPKQQLRSEDALSRLPPPWDSDKVTLKMTTKNYFFV
jgi:hypothetical protein